MKKFWTICALMAVAVVGFTFIACDDEEEELYPPTDTNYTASIAIKEATLKHEAHIIKYNPERWSTRSNVVIYEDYNYKYTLALGRGQLLLLMHTRTAGQWGDAGQYEVLETPDTCYVFPYLEQLDKVRGITDITEHPECYCDTHVDSQYSWVEYIPHYAAEMQPKCGYRGYIATEDGKLKYIRLHVKEYTLDEVGTLATATVMYQLY